MFHYKQNREMVWHKSRSGRGSQDALIMFYITYCTDVKQGFLWPQVLCILTPNLPLLIPRFVKLAFIFLLISGPMTLSWKNIIGDLLTLSCLSCLFRVIGDGGGHCCGSVERRPKVDVDQQLCTSVLGVRNQPYGILVISSIFICCHHFMNNFSLNCHQHQESLIIRYVWQNTVLLIRTCM